MQCFWALLLKQLLSLELFGDSLFVNHYNTVRLRDLNLLPLSLFIELNNSPGQKSARNKGRSKPAKSSDNQQETNVKL